ncbi:hypothetical protein AB0L82_38760 [Nocardia sp. NPDC052001]
MPEADDRAVREIWVADAEASPYGITTGADGALWLTLVKTGAVARIAP